MIKMNMQAIMMQARKMQKDIELLEDMILIAVNNAIEKM